MSTTDKALSLLALFSHVCPEIGLTDLSKQSGFDKATTLRHARALLRSGLLEQNPDSRRYRLGAEILRLANLREGMFPLRTVAQPVVEALAQITGETVHFSARAGDTLGTVIAHTSAKTVRIVVEPGLLLPWHATASGLAFLSQLSSKEGERLVELSVASHPSLAQPDASFVKDAIQLASVRGFAVCADRLERGVAGVASVVFDSSGAPIGTLAVALASAQFDRFKEQSIAEHVVEATTDLSIKLGASPQHTAKRLRAGVAV